MAESTKLKLIMYRCSSSCNATEQWHHQVEVVCHSLMYKTSSSVILGRKATPQNN